MEPVEKELPSAPTARRARTPSIDLARGAVMVLMALDHSRDFLCDPRMAPTNLASTSVLLFFTRWVTHFCAPVFVFLAGAGAHLYGLRHGRAGLSRFLVVRGLALVLLELSVSKLAVTPDPAYRFTVLAVLWALGCSMVILAGLSRLPRSLVLAIGVVIVLGHNLLDPFARPLAAAFGPAWSLLLRPGLLTPAPGHLLFVSYPILPWLGVMALGYGAGGLFERPAPARRRILLGLGATAVAAFVILRAANLYGDPRPWATQARGAAFTVLSFLNCEKYPPSLLFLLMTLGPALCALAAFEGRSPPALARPLLALGRVPLFFFLAHLVCLRLIATPFALARWGSAAFQLPPGHGGNPELPLVAAYLGWAAVLLLLYPLCRRFAAMKEGSSAPWLSYF